MASAALNIEWLLSAQLRYILGQTYRFSSGYTPQKIFAIVQEKTLKCSRLISFMQQKIKFKQ